MVIIALLLALRFRSFTADTLLPLTRIELPTPKSEVPASLSVPEPFVVRVVPPVEVIFAVSYTHLTLPTILLV